MKIFYLEAKLSDIGQKEQQKKNEVIKINLEIEKSDEFNKALAEFESDLNPNNLNNSKTAEQLKKIF